jgi:5-methylcytosine-specific restriction endonuclease McrA
LERDDVEEPTKRCGRCGEDQPASGYSPAKWGEKHGWCKACHSEYNRQRYQEKGEEIRARVAAWQAANRERDKARRLASYWSDVEASRARARKSAAVQNPKRHEAKLAWARADRAKNPEKSREKSRREYARDPLARKAIQHQRRAMKLRAPRGTVTRAGLAARWDFYGGRCWMCGGEAVEWDHVKPLSKGGAHCLANLRPACVPCNRRKSASWPLQPAA